MRTQKLLVAAAVLAVSVATSIAQPYSQNIVGYVNLTIPAGFSLIANPLNTTNNSLDTLFPNASFGDTVYKFNESTSVFDSSVFFGSWSPSFTLNPGEGAFYNANVGMTNTFVGTVLTGNLTNAFPAGFSIRSSIVPQSDTLENMGFTANFGDTIYFYRNNTYESSVYFGAFSPEARPAVGEAFWVNANSAGKWVRSFNP